MCKDLRERMFIHELFITAKAANNPGTQPQGTNKINDNASLKWNSIPPVKIFADENSQALMVEVWAATATLKKYGNVI